LEAQASIHSLAVDHEDRSAAPRVIVCICSRTACVLSVRRFDLEHIASAAGLLLHRQVDLDPTIVHDVRRENSVCRDFDPRLTLLYDTENYVNVLVAERRHLDIDSTESVQRAMKALSYAATARQARKHTIGRSLRDHYGRMPPMAKRSAGRLL
jgi:hypothetical protein